MDGRESRRGERGRLGGGGVSPWRDAGLIREARSAAVVRTNTCSVISTTGSQHSSNRINIKRYHWRPEGKNDVEQNQKNDRDDVINLPEFLCPCKVS